MTHIKDPKPEPLTAEREAALREWVSGVNRPDTPTTRWWQRDVAQLFATLDAARAETEAVRLEAAEERAKHTITLMHYDDQSERVKALRTLAAELVEAIEAAGAMPEGFCCCSENRIGDDSKIHQPECRDVRAVLARARAQGIGGEREKGDG